MLGQVSFFREREWQKFIFVVKLKLRFEEFNNEGTLKNATNFGLFFLRAATSAMMIPHGWQKLGMWSEMSSSFPDPLGVSSPVSLALAIGAELGCSLLLILGIGTRLASIPLFITMMVAALIIHANDPFQKQEFPLLYGVIYLSLVFLGSGEWSLGKKLFKNSRFLS